MNEERDNMTGRTDTEKAYITGFYAALKGILYITTDKEATVALITSAINDTLAEMEAKGELDDMEATSVDELIDLVKLAEELGKTDELFDMLDQRFGDK